jgi:hypothetical protein
MRAVEMTKLIVTALRMMPLPQAVAVPFFQQYFDEAGAFRGTEAMEKAARTMLDELRRWSDALLPMRRAAAPPAAAPAKPKSAAASSPDAGSSIAAAGSSGSRR